MTTQNQDPMLAIAEALDSIERAEAEGAGRLYRIETALRLLANNLTEPHIDDPLIRSAGHMLQDDLRD